MYIELYLDFCGIVVPNVGVLITQEPNEHLDEYHKTKLPGAISWNLINWPIRCLLKNMDH